MRLLASTATIAATIGLALGCGSSHDPSAQDARTCVYSGNKLSGLRAFDLLVHARLTCVVLFADAAPNWEEWAMPWFIDNRIPNENWSHFGSTPGNQLIITINMFPTPYAASHWRRIGAAGGYEAHAKALASNLVNAGLGRAVIRLGHEANGSWYPDNIGTTTAQFRQWKAFWRNTVTAMRSVPGAHFIFDWCVAAGYRPIPFSDYYPGDDIVDSIGVDIYDTRAPAGVSRWTYQYNRAGGVGAIARFAREHHKPLTIPEWGLEPAYQGGIGDDPGFTEGIARLVKRAPVSLQSYFFADDSRAALLGARESLRVYRTRLAGR